MFINKKKVFNYKKIWDYENSKEVKVNSKRGKEILNKYSMNGGMSNKNSTQNSTQNIDNSSNKIIEHLNNLHNYRADESRYIIQLLENLSMIVNEKNYHELRDYLSGRTGRSGNVVRK